MQEEEEVMHSKTFFFVATCASSATGLDAVFNTENNIRM